MTLRNHGWTLGLLLSLGMALVLASATTAFAQGGAADRVAPPNAEKPGIDAARAKAIQEARRQQAERKKRLAGKGAAGKKDPHAGHGHGPGEHGKAKAGAAKDGDHGHGHGEYEGALKTKNADDKEAHGNSKFAALLFWLFAFGAIGGSLFVITRRNMIVAVMGMVGTFFALAGLYAMLFAHFLAVMQILVYAGAIMVLFVFVIMILNAPQEQPWAIRGLVGKGVAGLALGYFLLRLAKVLWGVKDGPAAVMESPVLNGKTADFGSVRSIGEVLFTDHLFVFEAVSVVLLVAVVGAVAVARPSVTAGAQKEVEA